MSAASCAKAWEQSPSGRGTHRRETRVPHPLNRKCNVNGRVLCTDESGRKQEQRNRPGQMYGEPCVCEKGFRVLFQMK